MTLARSLLPFFAALLVGCGAADDAADREQEREPTVGVGIVGREPALLVAPSPGLSVAVSDAAYDQAGELLSFTAIVAAGADTTRAQLLAGSGAAVARLVVGNDTVQALPNAPIVFPVAIVPTGAAGLQIEGVDSLTIDTVSDEYGREGVSTQQFVRAGERWRATFSDYTRDDAGRVTGFRVSIEPNP